ncbi:hypothetical protein [Streptomyces puniciscabiei]|uniref:hypothetical protein n=1 Tax=Streptomyces puniciscabiei TaxID=164348 RepID=UPI0037B00382
MRDERHGRAALPDSRSRSGAFGHCLARTGTEPAAARSALRLRSLLSAVFLPLSAAATAGFAVRAAHSGPGDSPGHGPLTVLAVVCGLLTSVAAPDPRGGDGAMAPERDSDTAQPGSHG